MDDRFYERVKKYIRQGNMICRGESVVAGVSGGADSVCLLLLLLRLSREEGFFLQAVHVHHGLRASADADQQYVERLCAEKGLPCRCVQADASACAAQWGTGIEEAGRRIRYAAFEETCRHLEETRGTRCRIAVAHHLEDQAETVLFHLCRGTDLRGARGMLPSGGRIIRPLLEERRETIEGWLTMQGVDWQTDETNSDPAYTRNYLRAEVFPRLAAGINPGAADHLARFAKTAGEAEQYLAARTREALLRCRLDRGETGKNAYAENPSSLSRPQLEERRVIADADDPRQPGSGMQSEGSEGQAQRDGTVLILSVPALLEEDPYIQGRLLYLCLAGCTGTRRNLESVHVDAVRKLCAGQRNGQLSMPGGVRIHRTGGRLFFLSPQALDPSGTDSSGTASFGTAPSGTASFGTDHSGTAPFGTAPSGIDLFGTDPSGTAFAHGNPGERGCGLNLWEKEFSWPLSAEEYSCVLLEYDGNTGAIPRNQYTKWFDYDKIGTFPIFRTRQTGDRMTLLETASSQGRIRKKLTRIMLDGKIPAPLRDRIVLPYTGQEVLWVPGLRMGDAFRVGPDTHRILQIRWEPGAASEEPAAPEKGGSADPV